MGSPDGQPGSGVFVSTPWSLFRWRRRMKQRRRREALVELCRSYWRPIFCVLCQRGFARYDAEDLTQSFLLHFIMSGALARAHPGKGRFRDFLVGALDHYLINEYARERALKRGGGAIPVSLDDSAIGESNLSVACAPHDNLHCDRAWAADLLHSALETLEQQYVRDGRAELFRALKQFIVGDGDAVLPYAKLARRFRRLPVTLRSDVKRIRVQFREKLRDELRKKVGSARLDEEWENLRAILRSGSGAP